MARLPPNLRPKYLLRRKAMRHGLFGRSNLWRAVAFVLIFQNSLSKFFGKHPERLGKRRIGVGHVITVAAVAPLTRKQRKASGITRATLEAAARADLEAAQRAS